MSSLRKGLSWTMAGGCTKDLAQLVKLYLQSEALINHFCATQSMSLTRIVHSALSELCESFDLHISPHSKLFTDTMARILAPSPFSDVEPALTTLADRGVKLVCFPPHSGTTMQHLERVLPPAFRAHVAVVALPTPVHFGAGDDPWWDMYDKCKEVMPDVHDEEILILSAGMGRILVSAIDREYATALLKPPDAIERNVNFLVSELPTHTPTPSMTVTGLMELCEVLKSL